MRYIFLLFLLSLILNTFSQNNEPNYFVLSSLHWKYLNEGKIEKCLITINKIKKDYCIYPPDIPVFIKSCSQSNDTILLEELIIELFKNTEYDTSYVKKLIKAKSIINHKQWKSIKNRYDSLKLIYYQDFDTKLLIELVNMRFIDRWTRLHYPDSLLTMYSLPEIVDRNNFNRLKRIIKKRGFPEYSKIGKEGFSSIYYVFMHNSTYSNDNFIYIDSVMKYQMEKGNWAPWRYANIIDRYYWFKNGYQIFGTFIKVNEDGTKESVKIIDIENLDNRRKNIGLSEYYKYAKYMKFNKLPNGYKIIHKQEND